MYVCLCHALKERDIHDAASDGARKVSEVFGHYGVKAQCGRCVSTMRSMMGAGEPAGQRRNLSDGCCSAPTARRDAR